MTIEASEAKKISVNWDKAPKGTNAVFFSKRTPITNGKPFLSCFWERWINGSARYWNAGVWVPHKETSSLHTHNRIFKPQ